MRDLGLCLAAAATIVAVVTMTFLSPVAGLAATAVLAVLVAAVFRVPAAGFVAAAVLLLVVASSTSDLVDPRASVPLRLGGIACLVAAGLFRGSICRPARPHSFFIGLMLAAMGLYLLFATLGDGQYVPFLAELAGLAACAVWLAAATSWVPVHAMRSGLVIALVVAIAANVAAIILFPGMAFGLGRLRGLLENANGLGCFAVALGMLSVTVVQRRILAGGLFLVSVAVIAATGSRSSAAALLVTAAVIVLVEFRWPVKIGCLAAAGILLTSIIDSNAVIAWVTSRGNTREQTLEYAVSTFDANPWTGIGLDGELHEVASSPLRALVHAGVWGAVAVVVMWVALIAYGATGGGRGLAVALGVVTLSVFEGVLLSPISPFLLVLSACLITVQRTATAPGGAHRQRPGGRTPDGQWLARPTR